MRGGSDGAAMNAARKARDAASEDVILSEFSGPIYTTGGDRVQLDVRYEYMIAVKMDETNTKITTPPPSPSSSHP